MPFHELVLDVLHAGLGRGRGRCASQRRLRIGIEDLPLLLWCPVGHGVDMVEVPPHRLSLTGG